MSSSVAEEAPEVFRPRGDELQEILKDHDEWLKSKFQQKFQQEASHILPTGDVGRRAELVEADLKGVTLSYMMLEEANLKCADLRGAVMEGVLMQRATLVDADLRGADLTWAYFKCSDLRGADFRGANLSRVDFCDANLRGANLSGVDLEGAEATGADFRGAVLDLSILKFHYLEKAKFTPDALPWLILHPMWPVMKNSVTIESTGFDVALS